MPIDFPDSPTPGQEYTFGGKTYRWNGTYWQTTNAGPSTNVEGASTIIVSATAPADPALNQLWLDISGA
jgi:hypothetical protein